MSLWTLEHLHLQRFVPWMMEQSVQDSVALLQVGLLTQGPPPLLCVGASVCADKAEGVWTDRLM